MDQVKVFLDERISTTQLPLRGLRHHRQQAVNVPSGARTTEPWTKKIRGKASVSLRNHENQIAVDIHKWICRTCKSATKSEAKRLLEIHTEQRKGLPHWITTAVPSNFIQQKCMRQIWSNKAKLRSPAMRVMSDNNEARHTR
jgi:hypothetical protein